MGKMHAVTSPSSAERWLHCPPSAKLNAETADKASEAAAEGTAAHELAEYKVRTFLGEKLKRPVSDYDSDEMEQCTDDYLMFIRERIAEAGDDPFVAVEQQVDCSKYIPNGFGTTDCCIASKDTLYVIDLKYGKGIVVAAEDNAQMKIYALGCLEMFGFLYDFKKVSMTIFQPRRENVSTWEISVDDLKLWGEEVLKPAAEKAGTGEGEFSAGEWCRFCKAAATCRARADECLKIARMEFKAPALLSEDEMAEVLAKAQQVSDWASDVFSYCEAAAINEGRHFKGYKLVQGRSMRKFTSPEAVEKAVRDAGYDDKKTHTTSLITLTAFEKLMGKEKFNELLGPYVTRTTPKLSLVPETDKREEVTVNTAKDDFKGD